MINDNPKPNKVDMRGIQIKGIGGDLGGKDFKYMLFVYIIIFIVAFVVYFTEDRQKNNTHTIDCKTKVEPKI